MGANEVSPLLLLAWYDLCCSMFGWRKAIWEMAKCYEGTSFQLLIKEREFIAWQA
jgi:hypothetical protein